MDDYLLWMSLFHLHLLVLLIYAVLHKIWEQSETTMILIVGLQFSGLLMRYCSVGMEVVYLMSLVTYIYYRSMLRKVKKDNHYV